MRKVVTLNGVDYRACDDGETHINIYSKGSTELGRFLSNFTRRPVVTKYGTFQSLEGLYHFRRASDALYNSEVGTTKHYARLDELRHVSGAIAQEVGRKIRADFQRDGLRYSDLDEEFFSDFREALRAKIAGSDYAKAFDESTLPFTHYYIIKGGGIYHHPRFDWLSTMLEEIRDERCSA